jgi:hypothetical protein
MNKEIDLRKTGLRLLGETAGVEVARKWSIPAETQGIMDSLISLQFPTGNRIGVCVHVKRTLRPAHLAEIEYLREQCKAQSPSAQFLLISAAVSEPLAQELRRREIWFVDMVGNIHVDVPGQLLLFVAGMKPTDREMQPPSRRLSEQGARVLFQLLRHGPEMHATYRDLVHSTGVSLGMISKLFTQWRNDGLVRRAGRGAHLVLQPVKALNKWSDAYAEKLAPKLLIGRYHSAHDRDFASLLKLPRKLLPAVIGGEVAADVLTGYLRAGGLHLYTREEDAPSIRRQLHLAPSNTGIIELRRAFSSDLAGAETAYGMPLAHPALVYAELMAEDDDRLAETAMRLRQEHLAWTL